MTHKKPIKKLSPEQWDEIERRAMRGEVVLKIAQEFGITEGGIRRRMKPKKQKALDVVVAKVVEARQAVAGLHPSLKPLVEPLADVRMEIIEMTAQSARKAAQTAYLMTNMANTHAEKIDEHAPDAEMVKMVHALTETANKAAYQPLELLKASKEMANTTPEEPTTIDPAKLSSEARRELLEAKDAAPH